MGIISDSTFDPLHGYVNVRLRQGVPIVDSDWNELDDIRKFELRAFLKWFVGEGVPDGCNSFHIKGTGEANNFTIESGCSDPPADATALDKGLRYSGHCLIDGMSVLIDKNMPFNQQPLHAAMNPTPKTISASGGGGIVQPLTKPTADTIIVVYLDVWEVLVTADDESSLRLPGLGIESCSRVRRSWTVRTGTKLPEPTDTTLYVPGHSYYTLASITRKANVEEIQDSDIHDERRTRFSLTSLMERLTLVEKYRLLPRFNPSGSQFIPQVGVTGQNVTLHGSNFLVGTTIVKFGNVKADLVGQPTDNQIVVQVPAGVVDKIPITITTDGGSTISDDNFTALAKPSFGAPAHQFSPISGPVGVDVELFGQNFATGNIQVFFGDVQATLVGPITDTRIVAKVPPGVAGPVNIKVSNGPESDTSTDSFTVVVPPEFDTQNPFMPPVGSATQPITLHGKNFNIGFPNVLFIGPSGNVVAAVLGPPTATTINVAVPPGHFVGPLAPTPVRIRVTTAGGVVDSPRDFLVNPG